jgi:hypothetical protein
MSPRDQLVEGVRKLLEEQYFESVDDRSKDEYGGLNDHEKKLVLKAFLKKLAGESDTDLWAKLFHDVL